MTHKKKGKITNEVLSGEAYQQALQENLKLIKKFRLIDDIFFAVCFDKNPELAELILKIILDKDDLRITYCKTQYSIKNLHGHSVTLDAFAIDGTGKKYNIEVQKTDEGAVPQRARYYGSLIDSHMSLKKGKNYRDLPENYVIFITENDVIGGDLPIYHIERTIVEMEQNFGDGSHIIYVNAAHDSNTALGRLMKDFLCPNPGEMNYDELAEKTRQIKETEEGVTHMCEIMREAHNNSYNAGFITGQQVERAKMEAERAKMEAERAKMEADKQAEQAKIEAEKKQQAASMLKDNLTIEKVAKYTRLPLATVQEIAELLNA